MNICLSSYFFKGNVIWVWNKKTASEVKWKQDIYFSNEIIYIWDIHSLHIETHKLMSTLFWRVQWTEILVSLYPNVLEVDIEVNT